MDLRKFSRWFDDIAIYDAYTLAYLYDGQISAFIDSQVDGSISQRRVLSLDPDFVPPPRRVVTYLGEVWMVGDAVKDGLQGQALRVSLATKKSTETFQIQTPGQAALNTGGISAYGQKIYLKSNPNTITDAELDPFWEIYFTSNEPVAKGSFFKSNTTGKLYRARAMHEVLEGFNVAESDEIDAGSFVSATFNGTGTFDIVTETFTGGSLATTGVLLDMIRGYEYLSEADPKNKSGDQLLVVAKSAVTPVVNRTVTISGIEWKIFDFKSELDSWKLHLKRT